MIVKRIHMRRAKLCANKGRIWFRHHGLDWSDFIKNGIEADKLIETNDFLALLAVAEAAKDRELNGR